MMSHWTGLEFQVRRMRCEPRCATLCMLRCTGKARCQPVKLLTKDMRVCCFRCAHALCRLLALSAAPAAAAAGLERTSSAACRAPTHFFGSCPSLLPSL